MNVGPFTLNPCHEGYEYILRFEKDEVPEVLITRLQDNSLEHRQHFESQKELDDILYNL